MTTIYRLSELPDGEGLVSGDHGRAIDESHDSDNDSNKKILEVELGKHAGPESTNGEVCPLSARTFGPDHLVSDLPLFLRR